MTLLSTSEASTRVNVSGVGTTFVASGAIACSVLRGCRITMDSFPKVGGAVVEPPGNRVGSDLLSKGVITVGVTGGICGDVSAVRLLRFGCCGCVVCVSGVTLLDKSKTLD